MMSAYKESVAFDIVFGSILQEENTDNLFYNCRKLDKNFYFPKGFDKKNLNNLIRKSLTEKHDYIYDIVKDLPAKEEILGFTL